MRLIVLLLMLTITGNSMDKEILFKVLEDLEGSSDSRITKTEVGRYCITKAFFIDGKDWLENDIAMATGYQWKHCSNPSVAQYIILAYWKRYCPKALKDGDIRVLSAVFRKGPRGFENPTGVSYGKRALALYYDYEKRSHKGGSVRKD